MKKLPNGSFADFPDIVPRVITFRGAVCSVQSTLTVFEGR